MGGVCETLKGVQRCPLVDLCINKEYNVGMPVCQIKNERNRRARSFFNTCAASILLDGYIESLQEKGKQFKHVIWRKA